MVSFVTINLSDDFIKLFMGFGKGRCYSHSGANSLYNTIRTRTWFIEVLHFSSWLYEEKSHFKSAKFAPGCEQSPRLEK